MPFVEDTASTRAERVVLWVLAGFTVMALAGYAIFGRHPELLRGSATAATVYGAAFPVFARGQVLLSAAALFTVLIRRAGVRWAASLAVVYIASLSSELAGTTVGLPFGPYHYTDALGPQWFAHVPVLIPLSWFLMAVPSYAMARRLVGGASAWRRVAFASFILLAWDLALDPAMSYATKYWVWGASGPYYGMPWLNLFGWYVTGVVLMVLLAATRADAWMARLPVGWLAAYYTINLAMSLGIDMAARLDGAVVASLIPLLVCVAAVRQTRSATAPVTSRAIEA
jgi:uncharacterized membrane protein